MTEQEKKYNRHAVTLVALTTYAALVGLVLEAVL